MQPTDFDDAAKTMRSLVTLCVNDDPSLIGEVMVFPRNGMDDVEKIEFLTTMLFYGARLATQAMDYARTWPDDDLQAMWHRFCALRG